MFEQKKVKVSIIIPNWFTPLQSGHHGKDETFWFASHCLKYLLDRTPKEDYELILIDNGSSLVDVNFTENPPVPNPAFFPASYWDKADVLIKNKTNLGFAPACNQGVYVAKGEYIVLMNNDIIVWPNWMEAMINVFNQNLTPPVGVVMTALMKETSEATEALKLEKIDLTQNYGRWEPGAEFGSCFMVKRELRDKLIQQDGYFYDERFLGGFQEDRDLWKRVRNLGLQTYRCHETRVYHRGNMSMSKLPDRKKYTEANRIKFKEKWNIKE